LLIFYFYSVERNSEIERENRILLEKMTSILQNQKAPGATNTMTSVINPQLTGMGVSRDGTQQNFFAASSMQGSTLMNKKSLNRDARKRELMKITMENQKILQRLQDRSSIYNVTKWAKENECRKKLLNNICEYPY
jgi:hypothetical protein